MAYNSDQAEIDAMPMESGMATMSTAPGPDTATAMLNENVSNLRSAINGLSTQIMSLTRSTYSIAKSAAQGVTRDINIDSNAFGDRVGAAVGGPLGVIVHRAIANSGLTQTIGSSLRNGLSSLSSKIKSLGANKYDSQSGMFDASSITRSTQLQTSALTNELRSGISQPLKIANSIHNEQLTQTKIGNDSIVHAVDSLSKANRVDSSLSHNRLEMINRSINSTMPGMTEELTNAINGLNNSFRDSSVSQGGGLIKGVFKGILDMTKVGTLFKGKYTNDIQKSVNPLETQVSALLQIYRWQRLYGELTKRQLNQLIKLSGGQEQDVIGKNGVLSEFLTKNPDILNKVFDKAFGGGKLSGFAKFMSQMAIDSEAYDDRMRMAASADLSKLTKKKDVSGKDIFDTFVPFKSKTLSGPENYFDISYENLQKGLDALSGRFDGFDKVIKVMEHSGYDFYHSKQTEDNLKKLKEDKKKVKEDSSLSAEDKNKKIEDLDKEIKKLKEKQKETSKYKAEPRIFKNTKRTPKTVLANPITPNPIYDSALKGLVPGSIPVTIVGSTIDIGNNQKQTQSTIITGIDTGQQVVSNAIPMAKGGFVNKPTAVAGEAGPEAIVPIKKEKGNLTQKLADIITNSKAKLLEKILSKFETTNAILLESKKHQKDSSKTLESVAKYSKETANAETIENKIHLEEEKKKKKNSFWDNIGAKKKEKKPGGILGSLGSLLTNPYILMMIAAFILFPNQTKGVFKWMLGGVDRFLKGLTLLPKAKKVLTGGAKGIWQGIKAVSKGVGKGTVHAVKSGKDIVKGAVQGLKSGAKAIPIVKTVRTVGALMKQGKGLISSVGAVVGKNIKKTLAKGGLKAFAKRVPIISSLLSVAFAINRFRKGEIRGGLLELLSGGLGLIDIVAPGLGRALSLAIDFLNIWLDNKADKKKAEETKGVKGVGEKVEEVKKEKIPDKEKKDVSTNLEKAKEHAEKGNTIRSGYYGYQGAKDMKGAEDKKPKTPQPVVPYDSEYELYDGMILRDDEGNIINQRKNKKISTVTPTVTYDGHKKQLTVAFYKPSFNPNLPPDSSIYKADGIEQEPQYSIDQKTKKVTIRLAGSEEPIVIDCPYEIDEESVPLVKAYARGGFTNIKKYAEGGYYSTKPNYFVDTQNQLSVHGEAGPEAIIPLNNRPGNLLNNLGFELRNILYGYKPTGPISKDTSGSKSSVSANDSASLPMTRYLAMQIANIIKPYKNGGFKYEDPFIIDASQYYKIHSDKTSSFVDKTKISDTNGNIKEFGYTLQNSYLEPVQGFWKNFANEISNRFAGKDIFKPQVKTSTIQKYYDSESISNNRWFNNKNKGLIPSVSSSKGYADGGIIQPSEKPKVTRIAQIGAHHNGIPVGYEVRSDDTTKFVTGEVIPNNHIRYFLSDYNKYYNNLKSKSNSGVFFPKMEESEKLEKYSRSLIKNLTEKLNLDGQTALALHNIITLNHHKEKWYKDEIEKYNKGDYKKKTAQPTIKNSPQSITNKIEPKKEEHGGFTTSTTKKGFHHSYSILNGTINGKPVNNREAFEELFLDKVGRSTRDNEDSFVRLDKKQAYSSINKYIDKNFANENKETIKAIRELATTRYDLAKQRSRFDSINEKRRYKKSASTSKNITPGVSSGKSYDFDIKPISEKAQTAKIPESTPTKPNYENYGSAGKQYKDINDKNQNKTLSYTVTTSVNGRKVSKTYTFSTAGKFYDPIVSVRYITVDGKGTQIAIRTHTSGKISRRSNVTVYEGDDPDLWTSYDGKSTDKASNQPIIEKAKSAVPKEEKATAKERLSKAGSGALDIAKGLTGYEIAKGVVVGAGKGAKDTASNLVSAGGHFINAATSIPREVIIGTVKGAGQAVGGVAKGIGQTGWGALKGAGQAVGGVAKGIGQVGWGALSGVGQAGWGVLKGAGQAVGGIGKGIWNGAIKGVGGGLIDIIKGNGEEGLKNILKGIGTVGIETVKGLGKGIYSVGAGVVKGGWSLIKGTVKGIGSAAAGIVKGGWSLIKGTVKGIGSAVTGVVKGIYSVGKGLVKGAVGVMTGIGKGVWSLTKAVASLPVQIAKGTVNGVVNTYKSVKSGIGKIWDAVTGKKDKSNVPTGVNNYNIRTLASTKKEDSSETKKNLIVFYNLICKNKEFMKEHSFHVRDIMGSDKSDREKFEALKKLYSEFKGKTYTPKGSSSSGVTPQPVANYKIRVLAGENQPKTTKDIVSEGGAKILAHAGVYDKAVKGTAKLAKRGLGYVVKTGSKLLSKTKFGRNLLSRTSAIKNNITNKILKSKPASMIRVYKNAVKNLGFKKATIAASKGLFKSAKKATVTAAAKGYAKLKGAASAYKSLVSSKGFKAANKEIMKKASGKIANTYKNVKSSIKNIKSPKVVKSVTNALSKFKKTVGSSKITKAIVDKASKIKNAFKSKGFVKTITSGLSKAKNIAKPIVSKAVKSSISAAGKVISSLKNKGFRQTVKASVGAAKNVFKSNKVLSTITSKAAKLKNAVKSSKAFATVADKVNKVRNVIKSGKTLGKVTGIAKNVVSKTKGVASLARSAVKSKGFIGAAKAGLSSIKSAPKVVKAIQKGKNAISAAKAGFGIAKGVITGGFKTLMSGGLKSGLKAGLKGAMKGGWKAAIKKIPILGGILSLFFAFQRFKKGEWGRGIIELLSGVASCIPGIGTGISIVLDVLNMFLDAKMSKAAQETESIKNPETEKKEKKGPAWIARFMKYFNKAKNHWKKGNYLRAIGCGMAAMALGNPITGGITNWFMKKLGVVNDDDTVSGKDNEGVDDKAERERKKAEEAERKAEGKKKKKIASLTLKRNEVKKRLNETPDNIFFALKRSILTKCLENLTTELEQLGVKQNNSITPTSVDSAANQVTHAKDTTKETDGVQIIEKELGVTDQMKSDMKETEKLKATNKVYAHKKANEQLNKSINDNSSRTNNAIINSGKTINSSVSKVNNNIINNNSTENPTNSSIYMPVGAVNANLL